MRHLSTEELLLYANGELEDRELCHHVVGCVECKSALVDLQESYVLAASAIHEELPAATPSCDQVAQLRSRLAGEAQLLGLHLSTTDLLVSIEESLGPELEAHLAVCAECQSRAADLHVQLASIEYELRRESVHELPAVHRAAALAALRGRLEQETGPRQATTAWGRIRIPQIRFPQLPSLAPYAAACAGILLAAWLAWNVITAPDTPGSDTLARLPETGATAVLSAPVPAAPPATVEPAREVPRKAPARFVWTAGEPPRAVPSRPTLLASSVSAPDVRVAAGPGHFVPVPLPSLADLPEPRGSAPVALAPAAPEAEDPAPLTAQADPAVVADGSWMLVKAGLWKTNLQAQGTAQLIRFAGSVASERERRQAEAALLAAAGDRTIDFEITVRRSQVATSAVPDTVRATRTRSLGSTVRSSLQQHYRDAARRSFRHLDRSMLENELDLYVSDVMRHDADLLAHVHALHKLLDRADVDQIRAANSFRRTVRYHLDGIARNEASIYDRLSEALPRRYWAYRGPRASNGTGDHLRAVSSALLEDALRLDQALSSLFFEGSEALDVHEGGPSSASLLARLRQRTQQLRSAVR